jgi:hypothetical protein
VGRGKIIMTPKDKKLLNDWVGQPLNDPYFWIRAYPNGTKILLDDQIEIGINEGTMIINADVLYKIFLEMMFEDRPSGVPASCEIE